MNKKKLIIIIVLCVVVIAIASYVGYYLYKQSQVVVTDEKAFVIPVGDTTDIEVLSRQWFDNYIAQYTQKYLKLSMSLKDITITNFEVLDKEKNIVQIDFNARKVIKSSKYFAKLGSADGDDGSINCQWVLTFKIDKDIETGAESLFLVSRVRPVVYQTNEYISSGQASQDDYYYSNKSDTPYDLVKNTYKIEGKNIFVSYDTGKSWTKVPESLTSSVDTVKNRLQVGSYYISPEKTAFTYETGTNRVQTMIYSDDMGATWNTKYLSCQNVDFDFINVMYIYFSDKNNGIAICGYDVAMGNIATLVIKTQDGGQTWNKIGTGPKDALRRGSTAIFFNNNLGYICEPNADASKSTLYITSDGGNTFAPIEFPDGVIDNEGVYSAINFKDVFDTPNLPTMDNNILYVVVDQGSDGDYLGGKICARYMSNDMGKTWTYVEQFVPANEEKG